MITILGSTGKFCRMLGRHNEDDNERKENLPLLNGEG
jgi:hypothetical protein